jgi:hypothetical protein
MTNEETIRKAMYHPDANPARALDALDSLVAERDSAMELVRFTARADYDWVEDVAEARDMARKILALSRSRTEEGA